MIKRTTNRQLKKLLQPAKLSSKKQNKSLQKKTPRLILPRKLDIKFLPFKEWDKDTQSYISEKNYYDFRDQTTDLWWEEEDKTSLWGWKETEILNVPASYFLTTDNELFNKGREITIFRNILKGVCNIGDSKYLDYYLQDRNSPFNYVVPDEDVGIINTTIQLYEENYNDRIANLKAAFEKRKLEYLQSSSVPTKVSRLPKRIKSVSL